MTDLEQAAHQAVEALGTLGSSVHDAREHCTHAARAVSAAAQRLAADRAELATALDALQDTLEDAAQRIPEPAVKAEGALIVLGRTCAESSAEWTPLLETEVQGLDALAVQARHAAEALHGWSEGAAAQGQTALARTVEIEEALHGLLARAEQDTSETLPAWLAEVGEEVEHSATRAREVLAQVCEEMLADKREQWDARLKDVRDVLVKAFADMKAHAEATAEYALEQGASLVEAALERRGGEVASVEMELRELDAEIASARAHLAQLVEELIGGLRDADETVVATLQAWRATVERWREVGYR